MRLLLAASAMLVLACAANPAHAAWPDPSVNVPVCVHAGDQLSPSVVSDGNGGLLVSWSDNRSGVSRTYLQHVLYTGSVDPSWMPGGRGICPDSAAGAQFSAIGSDGAGGLFVEWTTSSNRVLVHHVLASGADDPVWPPCGQGVTAATTPQLAQSVAPDGAGGAYAVWLDRTSSSALVMVQHMLPSGVVDPAWPQNGIVISTPSVAQGPVLPNIDGSGGVFLSWRDEGGPSGVTIRVHHLTSAGADPAWPASGRALTGWFGFDASHRVTLDGTGGVIVAWTSVTTFGGFNPDQNADIFAQHVLASSQIDPTWPANGVTVCSSPSAQWVPTITSDGAGGAIISWHDYRPAATRPDIYAHHVLASGVVDPIWPINGKGVRVASGAQGEPRLVSDGDHGAIVVWSDTTATVRLYAQHILATGALDPSWPAAGSPVSTATGDKLKAVIVGDAPGVMVIWSDTRTDAGDIYAQRLGPASLVDVDEPRVSPALALAAPRPNPARGGASLRLTVPMQMHLELDIVDASGRRIRRLLDTVLDPGEHAAGWDLRDESDRSVPTGVYFAIARFTGGTMCRRIAVVR